MARITARLFARGSLAQRLFLTATASTLAILLIAGLALSGVYRRGAERAFDERLHVYIKEIVAGLAAPQEPQLPEARNFGEPRFDLPFSGWYWQVERLQGPAPEPELVTSPSLLGQRLPDLATLGVRPSLGERREGYATGPDERRLRIVERVVDLAEDGRYRVAAAAPGSELDAEVRRFDLTLAGAFALLGVALVGITLFQVLYGLRPLVRLGDAVGAVRRGEAERVDGDYPRDLAPLAQEINLLLTANREILERARTHVGNLAHALKTPLSVIANEASATPGPLAEKVSEQAAVMRDQVNWYLDRARAAARAGSVTEVTPVEPVLAGLIRVFEKINAGRGLRFEVATAPEARFRGERQDLEEMAGNLIDNAGKWASGLVRIQVERIEEQEGRGARLALTVDDDGPGMPDDARAAAPRRGRRLDESKPGSGLGLSIVAELADLYGGALTLDRAPEGGLRARLELPGA